MEFECNRINMVHLGSANTSSLNVVFTFWTSRQFFDEVSKHADKSDLADMVHQ